MVAANALVWPLAGERALSPLERAVAESATTALRRPFEGGEELLTARKLASPVARIDDAHLRALAARVVQHDQAAFDEIYKATREEVARTLFHLAGARADLEDLIQETYVRLLSAVKSFRGESQFRTFLYRICANVAFSHRRWWKRRPEEPMAELPEQTAPDRDPEAEAQRQQAARLVQRALEKLTDKKRVVFVCHELLGMMPEEIGVTIGASPNTVRSRLHHARFEFNDAMKRLLERGQGGSDAGA